ncbi:guanylate kinase [Desulfonatronum thiosulfatophilum]|uniref:Guanylate kinase n=1 Tax=Desulfonatronum thiosulfatophilum TaxID=617002 RepID=A0A1G6BYD4_9BACT|nr:guanylate kinase [Desulfonatronum thiosulfatophilum]SDB25642.1 guanylate kinase [Desulfonatronum thiosulfatophilum]
MSSARSGLLLVISAPSGTGKSTLIKRLRQEFPRLAFSVSYTTRPPRPGEENGRDYHFVSKEQFHQLQVDGSLAEWAEVHGNLYGTSQPAVQEMLNKGSDVLFDIDVQGARQLRQAFDYGSFIFLFPPSRQVLEQRLRGRGTEDSRSLNQRLANARRELEQAELFDTWIINDDLEQAYRDLRSVYLAEGLRSRYNGELMAHILSTWTESKLGSSSDG